RIYRLHKQKVEDNGQALPLDQCFVLREGGDITLVTWGAMVHETMKVASTLANQGIEAEVIDIATIKPLDMETILTSVEKTGRCVIIHEAASTCGVGAEIAAHLAEYALTSLYAAIQRATGFDTIMPLYQLENHYMPSAAKILQAVQNTLEYA